MDARQPSQPPFASVRPPAPSVGGEAVRELFDRGGIYAGGYAAQVAAQVAVLPVITRLLDRPEYGLVAVGLVVTTLLSALGGSSLGSSISRRYFMDGGPAQARALVPLVVVAAATVALAAELTGPVWTRPFEDVGYGAALRVAVWLSVAAALRAAVQELLRAERRAGRFVLVALVASVGGQAIGIVLVASGLGATGYLAGLGVGNLVAATLGLVAAIGPLRLAPGLVGWAAAFGLPIAAHQAASVLLDGGDRFILERLSGLGSVGGYHVAATVGAVAISAATAVNLAWSPIVFGAAEEDRWTLVADTRAAFTRVVAIGCAAVAVLAPLALRLLLPGGYDTAELGAVSAVTAFAVMPYLSRQTSMVVLMQRQRTGPLAWSTIPAAAISLGMCVALVPPLGLVGAAVATVAGFTVQAAILRALARRLASIPARRGPVAASWALAGTVAGAAALAPAGGAWLGIRAVVGLALACGLIVTMRRLLR